MEQPKRKSYEVVIVGGAMFGSSLAWFLSDNPDFDGTILVVERDPSYEYSSTAHTNSCMRQQFSNEINIRISQFAAEYVKNFREYMGNPSAPELVLQNFGYMYLADNAEFAQDLKRAQEFQRKCGAGTKHMNPEEIKRDYPFFNVDDIIAANHNLVDEGYFDGGGLFDWWKRCAREKGAEYIHNEVTGFEFEGETKISHAVLKSGEKIACSHIVNASGPRARRTAEMAGIEVPIEPRKRYTFVFSAENRLDRDLPLTIDPSGVHMRSDGLYYLAGCPPDDDPPVDYDDFEEDFSVWEEKAWPALAHRIGQFEAIRLERSWVGHYAFNRFDQNAVIGPHSEIRNFFFLNGFSGHGLQQSPAMGRGLAERIVYGKYRTLDLSPFEFDRIERNEPFMEKAVI